jgi:hypothetical protein
MYKTLLIPLQEDLKFQKIDYKHKGWCTNTKPQGNFHPKINNPKLYQLIGVFSQKSFINGLSHRTAYIKQDF